MTNPSSRPSGASTEPDWYCNHGYGQRSEQWEPHRSAVESPGSLADAAQAVLDAAYSDRDGRNIIIPLREPNGALRTEWERLGVAVMRAGAASTEATPPPDEGEFPDLVFPKPIITDRTRMCPDPSAHVRASTEATSPHTLTERQRLNDEYIRGYNAASRFCDGLLALERRASTEATERPDLPDGSPERRFLLALVDNLYGGAEKSDDLPTRLLAIADALDRVDDATDAYCAERKPDEGHLVDRGFQADIRAAASALTGATSPETSCDHGVPARYCPAPESHRAAPEEERAR